MRNTAVHYRIPSGCFPKAGGGAVPPQYWQLHAAATAVPHAGGKLIRCADHCLMLSYGALSCCMVGREGRAGSKPHSRRCSAR